MTIDQARRWLTDPQAIREWATSRLDECKEMALRSDGAERWYLRGCADVLTSLLHTFRQAEGIVQDKDAGRADELDMVLPAGALQVRLRPVQTPPSTQTAEPAGTAAGEADG